MMNNNIKIVVMVFKGSILMIDNLLDRLTTKNNKLYTVYIIIIYIIIGIIL